MAAGNVDDHAPVLAGKLYKSVNNFANVVSDFVKFIKLM
jgi:hypothetical protein